ncbi:hypothetical protein CEXT_364621 [Caerostris extrusa]|uniref:Uncharacterized protein n=1 Tax=Caerostris extrusa TaxID=172846 RepID=A0AAV4VD68_CAEEX|nr:hypothetical protein CEXT_364621 [Caerostris extrusa]
MDTSEEILMFLMYIMADCGQFICIDDDSFHKSEAIQEEYSFLCAMNRELGVNTTTSSFIQGNKTLIVSSHLPKNPFLADSRGEIRITSFFSNQATVQTCDAVLFMSKQPSVGPSCHSSSREGPAFLCARFSFTEENSVITANEGKGVCLPSEWDGLRVHADELTKERRKRTEQENVLFFLFCLQQLSCAS